MTGKYATGDHISFTYKEQQLEGTVVKLDDNVTIKLSSGYNIVVSPAAMKQVETVPAPEKQKGKQAPVETNPDLPTIAILHTGGTVASKVDYSTGAVIAGFSPEQIVELFPELTSIANIKSRLVSNIQSEMMRFAHWNILAKAVDEEVQKGVDGVIITHGTDVLHMTSAALAFALGGIQIPVMLVGSQRSSDRPSSDAASNLLCAAKFIVDGGWKGVGLCMHEGVEKDDCIVHHPCRVRKMHTSRRDAFRSINDSPYARITYPGLKVERLREWPGFGEQPRLKLFDEDLKVGLLYCHPQMHPEEFSVYGNFDGLVLGLLGIGHAPTMKTDEHNAVNDAIYAQIKKLAAKMPVAGAPQTIYGRINMNVYTPGRQLIEAGVLGQNLDMTPETAFVKLAWLLSNHKDDVKELYGTNLIGELTERTEERQFDN